MIAARSYWTLCDVLDPLVHVGALLKGATALLFVIPSTVRVSGLQTLTVEFRQDHISFVKRNRVTEEAQNRVSTPRLDSWNNAPTGSSAIGRQGLQTRICHCGVNAGF